MSFTSAQLLTISEILEITPQRLNSQIVYIGSLLTVDIENKVVGEFAEWENLRGKFTRVQPTAANYGAQIDPEDRRAAIRKRVALWLGFEEASTAYSAADQAGGRRLSRG